MWSLGRDKPHLIEQSCLPHHRRCDCHGTTRTKAPSLTLSCKKYRFTLHHIIHCPLFCSFPSACSITNASINRSQQHPFLLAPTPVRLTHSRPTTVSGWRADRKSQHYYFEPAPSQQQQHNHPHIARSALANAALHEHIDIYQALGLFSCA